MCDPGKGTGEMAEMNVKSSSIKRSDKGRNFTIGVGKHRGNIKHRRKGNKGGVMRVENIPQRQPSKGNRFIQIFPRCVGIPISTSQ